MARSNAVPEERVTSATASAAGTTIIPGCPLSQLMSS